MLACLLNVLATSEACLEVGSAFAIVRAATPTLEFLSKYTDTGRTGPGTDPIKPFVPISIGWHDSTVL